MEPDDPFTEGIPDFGNEALNLLAQNLARGVQTAKAIASIDDMAALMKGGCIPRRRRAAPDALCDDPAGIARAVDPDFKPEYQGPSERGLAR